MLISMLLLTGQRPLGYVTFLLAPILMVSSTWFWVDLNEELADLPLWRPLPLTVRAWRWSLSGLGLLSASLSFFSLQCVNLSGKLECISWLEAPQALHKINERLFNFLFGANWTEQIAAFIGYIALIAYLVGILQWLLVRLPKTGRIAGEF